jgi:hypothetical protein
MKSKIVTKLKPEIVRGKIGQATWRTNLQAIKRVDDGVTHEVQDLVSDSSNDDAIHIWEHSQVGHLEAVGATTKGRVLSQVHKWDTTRS